MARRTHVQLTDDLDGSVASQTITFSVGGTSYELDVNDRNAARFAKALEPYVSAARRVRGGSTVRRSVVSGEDVAAIRAWAVSKGFEVSSRGRLPRDVVEAYHAAA